MVLVIDVGNTNTLLGLLDGDQIVQTWRITTRPRTTDELGGLVMQLLTHRGFDPNEVQGAISSSVVPSLVYTVDKALRQYPSGQVLGLLGRRRPSLHGV